jgi:hypothetical protein
MRPVEPYQGDRLDGSWAAEWVEADGKERLQSFVHIVRDRLLAAIGDPLKHREGVERIPRLTDIQGTVECTNWNR